MKRYVIPALVLVLVCGLFTGCRRMETMPSNPTNEATDHVPTVAPTTPATKPVTTEPTIIPPTERLPNSTTGTDATTSTGATDATENAGSRYRREGMR